MSTSNSTFSDRVAVVGVIDPDNYTASGTYDKLTDAIDMSRWGRVAFVIAAGDIEDTGTVDFKITESDTSSGTYTDVSGKVITQLITSDDDKQAVVEISTDELGAGKRYIKGALRTATAASDVSAVALAIDARNEPASDGDLSTVAQILS